MKTSRAPDDDIRFNALLVAGGVALRLLWLWKVHGGIDVPLNAGEATRVALAFARDGSIADAYFSGQGPTAHLMPLPAIIAGTVMRVLGSGSGGTLALVAWSLVQGFAAILIVRGLYGALGMDRTALRWATALLCLIPVYVQQEAVDFRFWEGALATTLAATNLWWIVAVDRRKSMATSTMIGAGLLAGLTFFVSPPVGLAIDLCWAMVALRRLAMREAAGFAGIALLGTLVFVAPWMARNQMALGEPIPTRSNLGLELALANHPAAMTTQAPEQVFAARLWAIHPYDNMRVRPEIIAHGEAAYARRRGAEARAWIAAHPGDALRLWGRHLRQFLFPQSWQLYFSGWDAHRALRAGTVSIVQGIGLIGVGWVMIQRRRGYGYVVLYLAALALPFAAFQPTARYSYLLWPMLAFPAVALLIAAGRRIGQIRQPPHLAPAAHHRIEDQPGEQA